MSGPDAAGDLRVRRTRMALREALLEMLAEQPFEQVTVSELTGRALVNRATFYRHYRDKEDLAARIFEDAVDDLVARAGPPAPDFSWLDPAEPPDTWTELFAHVRAHAPLYRALVRSRTLPWFEQVVRRALTERVQQRIAAVGGPPATPLLRADLGLAMIASAWVGAVAWWLEHGDDLEPAEMAAGFGRFAMYGYLRCMGFPTPPPDEPTSSPAAERGSES